MQKQIDYSVVYSDDEIAVLNKRSGLLIAADRYNPDAPRLDLIAEQEFGRLYAVHRIDKDTSGIIIYARTPESHRNLSRQFEERGVEKIYHAIIYGRPSWETKRETAPLLPDGDSRHRTVIDRKRGKPSVTDFTLKGSFGLYSWIEARPKTGRTHQIRAHLAAEGLSILCDPLYGGNQKPLRLSEIKRNWRGDDGEERPLVNRLALHAYRIGITHPSSGEKMSFTAPYQKDMEAARRQTAKIFGVDPVDD